MAIYKGDKEVARMYLGTKEVTSIYKGSKLVWIAKKPWVEYADGVLTFHYDSLQKACANTNYDLNTGTTAPAWKAENAANVTKVVFDESFSKARPTSCYQWFSSMKELTDIEGLDYLNTSKVTRMDGMYNECYKLYIDIDLSRQDWSSLTNLGVFGSVGFKSLKVPKMAGKSFPGCSYFISSNTLTSLDLSPWDISINGWMAYWLNLPKVTDLKMAKVSGITYMAQTFLSLGIDTIDEEILGKLDTSNVGYMGCMFARWAGVKHIDMSCLSTKSCQSLDRIFMSCYNLESVSLPFFADDNVLRNVGQMYENCYALESVDLSVFNKVNTKNITNMSIMFNGCKKLKSVDISMFNGAKVTTLEGIFCNCNVMTDVVLGNIITSNVTNMSMMFKNCYALLEIDLSEIDTSKVTNMSQMFYQCKALAHIYVSDLWDVSKVTDSTDMFKDCESLPNYDATKIDVSMAKYDTDGGYLTFRRYFMINKERFYIYDRNLVYEGDLGFSDSDEYVCSFNFTLGANNTAVYQRYKAAGDPESIILPFSINTDDYSDVTFYDMDGNELVGETIDGGTEFGIEVSTGHTIVFQSEKGATIVKSSLVYPETISTMDLEDDEISDNMEAYEIPDIEKPEGWVD